jgi:hypothetical protein
MRQMKNIIKVINKNKKIKIFFFFNIFKGILDELTK